MIKIRLARSKYVCKICQPFLFHKHHYHHDCVFLFIYLFCFLRTRSARYISNILQRICFLWRKMIFFQIFFSLWYLYAAATYFSFFFFFFFNYIHFTSLRMHRAHSALQHIPCTYARSIGAIFDWKRMKRRDKKRTQLLIDRKPRGVLLLSQRCTSNTLVFEFGNFP